MNPVEVRNIKIGEGIPKICVPIVGKKREEIIAQAKAVASLPEGSVDLAEWRADWFDDVMQEGYAEDVLGELRKALGEKPLLFTFRTAGEGGKKTVSGEGYVRLIERAVQTGYVDLVDVELFMGDGTVKEIIKKAHDFGIKVIVSNHDFSSTPAREELLLRMEKMLALGADIPKIAVMPKSRGDVLTLLAATEEMTRRHAECPVITMSMGETGVISRICGETFGSAVTFGSAGKESAPGQVGARDLHTVLGILHGKTGDDKRHTESR